VTHLQSVAGVASIVEDWEAATGMRLLYPTNYDGRRDAWEQSERILKMVEFAKEETGCSPIIVAFSTGSFLVQNAFARFGREFADMIHGVLYTVGRL
jgi:hypothetical protein